MVEELMGAYGGRFIIAVLGVALGLACLIAVLWLLRGRSGPSPFVRGGKNRQPRLQVLDAAAVDTRRRLVLVRRDEVEHLVMIGGPTDIVIESGIASTTSREAPSTAADSSPIAARSVPPHIPAPEPRPPVEERRPVPIARPAAPEVEASPRPRQEPVLQVSPAAVRPIQAPAAPAPAEPPPPARPVAAVGAAEKNALDAARGRVLGTAPEPARPTVAAFPQQTEQPKVLGSDFERILEEEMASNLAAREGAPGATPATPARNPAVPPVTGATPEPNLQAEVARIFGEMSVTRDK